MSDPLTPAVSDRICAHMNEDHAEAVLLYAHFFGNSPQATAAKMLSIDPQGMNLSTEINGTTTPLRIEFERSLEHSEDAHQTLIAMLKQARASSKS